ncbi:MAG: NCS2 family permease [Bacillota bacterium]|nr:NCS2 family permease [Bacillota bacterium]
MGVLQAEQEARAAAGSDSFLERLFRVRERGSSLSTEVTAGLTTFMTMAYILFVNPAILGDAGVPKAGAAVATALAAGIMTIAMGLVANAPFALASGMGLNAALTYGLVAGQHVSWQTAMGVVFVEGAIVTLLVLTNVREAVMNAIPLHLKKAIGVGIGLFIALIGLVNSKLVVASPATVVTFGSVTDKGVILTVIGLLLTAALVALRIRGAILLGIIGTTLIGIPMGITHVTTRLFEVPGAASFATFGQLDIAGALRLGMLAAVFAFMMTDFFDTMGTVVAVGGEAGLLDKEGRLPNLRNILLVDSLAAMVGGLFGASSVTTYVESSAGVAEGGRTGLTSLVTGLLFLVSVFFAPLFLMVPSQATAPALIVVGFLMMSAVRDIPFDDFADAFPAFVTLLTIPVTYSISRGIGYGLISYCVIKLATGRAREVHWALWIVAALFALSFVLPA